MTNHTLESFPWASYHNITIENAPKLPSRHHYYLVQPLVPGFALGEKKWRKSILLIEVGIVHIVTTNTLLIILILDMWFSNIAFLKIKSKI